MNHQSEQELEKLLVEQLRGLGFASVAIRNREDLLQNLQQQLEAFNKVKFTAHEFTKY